MLKDIQQQVANAILFDGSADFISSNNAMHCIGLYRQEIEQNLSRYLFDIFHHSWDIIEKNTSSNTTLEICRKFWQQYLPESGCIYDWGQDFPIFLKREFKELPYLYDVAKLEWMEQQSWLADNPETLDLDSMHLCNMNSSLELHPSLILFFSEYNMPLLLKKQPKVQEVDHFAIIYNYQNNIVTEWIDEDEWKTIKKISQGIVISQAYRKGTNFKKIISKLFSSNLVVKCA